MTKEEAINYFKNQGFVSDTYGHLKKKAIAKDGTEKLYRIKLSAIALRK